MSNITNLCISFLKKETVLCAAIFLAVVSCIFVPPGPAYAGYVDWNTLALLFSLMAVMKGLQKCGVFVFLSNQLLKRTKNSRSMLLVLVLLPFWCSMVITNDVALITFVPFGMIALGMAGQERLLIPLVALQTVAANLGSMLTPMGNPQNLYLYTKSGMGFWELCSLMLPYVLLSGICIVLLSVFQRSEPIKKVEFSANLGSSKALIACLLGFVICLLGLFKLISPVAIAVFFVVVLWFADRKILREIDYSLLGTFLAFFIFIGNIGGIEGFQRLLAAVLADHVELTAILASQVISNVPAALLLSGFTTQWEALIVGCNLGGLGTLIASMASLISYKMVVKEYPQQRSRYLGWFTLCNVCLLLILLAVHMGLK